MSSLTSDGFKLPFTQLVGSGTSRDASRTLRVLYICYAGGVAIVVWKCLSGSATALLWAHACVAAGAALGFLFGIPRVLQADGGKPATAAGTTRAASERYSQQVNTNLEQISDWLTKILVGLGLIELYKVPGLLNRLAAQLAPSIRDAEGGHAFAVGLIVYFSILGFFLGYLATRLYLAGAFFRADTANTEFRQVIDEGVRKTLAADPNAGDKPPTEQQLALSESVRQAAVQGGPGLVREQVMELCQEYERIRASMTASADRTRRTERIVAKMRALALAARPLLDELKSSGSGGCRLFAIAVLQVRPEAASLDWLAERMREQPFVGYQAAIALQTAARVLPEANREDVRRALGAGKAELEQSGAGNTTDRARVLEDAQRELDSRASEK